MKRNIIIAPYEAKRKILSKVRKEDIFKDIKFLTKEEFISSRLYSYNDETIKYLIKEKDMDLEYASSLINNLIYLDEHKYNPRFENLFSLKKELINKGLLRHDDIFDEEIKDVDIDVYYYPESDPELNIALEGLNKKFISIEGKEVSSVLKFENNDDQLLFVFNEIERLLNEEKVSPNKIFLYGLLPDDEIIFERLKANFEINFNSAFKKKYITLPEVRNFISSYSGNFEAALLMLDKDTSYHDDLLDILKAFYIEGLDINKQRQLYYDLLSKKNIKQARYKEAINVIDEPVIEDDEYLFIINYAQGVFPKFYRDNDFLDDIDKEELGLPTSKTKNKMSNDYYQNLLRQKGRIYLAYPLINLSSKMMPSSYFSICHQEEKLMKEYSKLYSFSESRIQRAKLLDIKRKYLEESRMYKAYEKISSYDDYLSYNPQFNGEERFGGFKPITLSYSSVKTFYQCPYKYYANKVLEVDELEPTFVLNLGNFAHKVLEHIEDGKSFEETYEEIFSEEKDKFKPEELVFFKNIKEELKECFNHIKEHEGQVINPHIEREIEENIKLNGLVSLKGVFDKIIVSGDNEQYISIIDYKSGSEKYNENDVQYGLSMQLPTYALMCNSIDKYKDKKIIALAIQPILKSDIYKKSKFDTKEIENQRKMNGVYLDDFSALESLDSTLLTGSKYLSGAGITKSGVPDAKAKFRNEDYFLEKAEQAKELTLYASEEMINRHYKVNPKIKGGKLISCTYCPFRDICYRDPNTFEVLDNKDGGESDE